MKTLIGLLMMVMLMTLARAQESPLKQDRATVTFTASVDHPFITAQSNISYPIEIKLVSDDKDVVLKNAVKKQAEWQAVGDGTYTYYYKEYQWYWSLSSGWFQAPTGRCSSSASGTNPYDCTSGM